MREEPYACNPRERLEHHIASQEALTTPENVVPK